MSTFINLLKTIDVFGYTPGLIFRSSTKYHTLFGGLINSLILIFGVFACFFFGRELWERRNPITNLSTEFDPNPTPKNFFFDFQFIINIQSQIITDAFFIDETIYTVQAYFFDYNLNSSFFNITNLEIERCSKDSFGENHFDLFSKYPYENGWCLRKTEDLQVEKLYGQDGFKMLRINVNPCKNTTYYNKCAPKELIKRHLDGTFATVFSLNNNIQSSNFKNPLQSVVENYFSAISTSTSVDMAIKMRSVEFKTDSGFLVEEIETTPGYINENPIITLAPPKDDYIFSVNFQCFNKKDLISRSYYKIQTLVAQIGGLINFLHILSRLLMNYYNKHYFYLELLNELFFVHKEITYIVNRVESDLRINNYTQEKRLAYKFPQVMKKIEKQKYPFFNAICSNMRKKHKGSINQFYNLSTSIIKNQFEVTNFIKRCFDMERIKYFLFNEDQRKTFDILSCCKLPLNESPQYSIQEKENYYTYLLSTNKKFPAADNEVNKIINNVKRNPDDDKNKKFIELLS